MKILSIISSYRVSLLSKSFLAVLCLDFYSFQSLAQNLKPIAAMVAQERLANGSFDRKTLFTPIADPQFDKLTEGTLKQKTIATLDKNALRQLYRSQAKSFALSLPLNGQELVLELVKVENLSTDFKVITNVSDNRSVAYKPGVYYRGIIAGDNNSVVGLSLFENEVMGLASCDKWKNIVIAQFDQSLATDNYILYSDNDLLVHSPFTCGTPDLDHPHAEPQSSQNEAFLVDKCIRVYLEGDYHLYQNKGNTISGTANYLTGAFNNMAALYQNEDISTTISTIFVWTSQDNYSRSSSRTALDEFGAARPNFNGELAHLLATGGGGLGGIAWLSALCNTGYKYAYSNIGLAYSNIPTYSWTIMVMTHEMGHNLGSNHTQWCGWTGGALDNCYTTEGGCAAGPAPTNGGTIMSYCHLTSTGINLANGFGQQPGERIRSFTASASCVSNGACTLATCYTPVPSASSITLSSATISWNNVVGVAGYKVEYKPSAASTWSIATNNTSSTSINLTGLNAATAYDVHVFSLCSVGESIAAELSFSTINPNDCADSHEPNNSFATAKMITPNSLVLGGITVSGDTDFFTFTTTSTAPNILIHLTNVQPATDIDMVLYDDNQTLITESVRGAGAQEIIVHNTASAGTYFIRLFGYTGSTQSPCYRLTLLTDTAIQACPPSSH
jgi:hypothetical protein